MPPKVSVAIITYNQKAYLLEAIESVLAQDYPDLEIVVADDASSDGTQELLRGYERRYPGLFKLVLAETNGGITANCNCAFFACTGTYIAWLGGDDLMLPGRLAKQVEILDSNPRLAICVSAADVFDSATNTTMFIQSAKYRGMAEYGCGHYIESGNCVIGSATMVRRSMCPSWGHDTRVPVVSDFLFFAEVSRNGPIFAQDEILTRYRRHGTQITAVSTTAHPDPWITLQILEFKYPEMAPYTHAVRADYNFTRGFLLLKDGKHAESRIFLRTSLFYRKRPKTLFWLLFACLPAEVQQLARTTKIRLRTRKEPLA